METRVITQTKIYYLVMNPVTDRAESGRITIASFDKQRLIAYYEGEIVEPYNDDRFRKVFRQGGPLEWYNPLWTLEGVDTFGHGLKEDWVESNNINQLTSQYLFV